MKTPEEIIEDLVAECIEHDNEYHHITNKDILQDARQYLSVCKKFKQSVKQAKEKENEKSGIVAESS